MTMILAGLLAAACAAAEERRPPEVRAMVLQSGYEAHVRLEKYRAIAPGSPDLPYVLCGHFGDEPDDPEAVFPGGTISILAEPDVPHRSSANWMKEFLERAGELRDRTFEVDGIACCSGTTGDEELGVVEFNAIVVAAGFWFDLHVSQLRVGGVTKPLDREAFAGIVRSFRIDFHRPGRHDEQTTEVLDLMDGAAREWPRSAEWLEARCKSTPDASAPHLVLGEHHRLRNEPAKAIPPYTKALAILKGRKEPSRQEKLMAWYAGNGLGLSLAGTGKMSEAAGHFQRCVQIARDLADDALRGSSLYNLACTHGERGEAVSAAKFLREAIGLDPAWRGSAEKDASFDRIRSSPEFRAALKQ